VDRAGPSGVFLSGYGGDNRFDPDQKFLKWLDALAFLLCVFAARADLRRRSG